MKITLDLLSTTGVAAFVVLLGNWLVARIKLLRDFCIPAPAVSGLLVSIILCILKVNGILTVLWSKQLMGWSMNLFFTAVGLGFHGPNFLRQGGRLCINMAIAPVS